MERAFEWWRRQMDQVDAERPRCGVGSPERVACTPLAVPSLYPCFWLRRPALYGHLCGGLAPLVPQTRGPEDDDAPRETRRHRLMIFPIRLSEFLPLLAGGWRFRQ